MQNFKRMMTRREGLLHIILLVLVIAAGSLVRLAMLESDPMGLHQDEAYSAYNAWAVMHYGIDSYGYTRPVYYTVWGSGMSVLYSYLTMPFLALFGVKTWVIRLPQALLGNVCIVVMYGLGRELRGKWTGLAFAALLAVNPWHVLASRFGLDANLAVPMLLFGMYFLCRYLNGKRKSIWGAAVFLGLTLYCYALTWILVPVILLFTALFFRKYISWDKQLLGAVLVLFVIALPLLLFLCVNFDLIPEIRTGLFSVPRLPAIRTGELEFSLGAVKRRLLWLLAILWVQHDDLWWVSDSVVGSYYYFSTPFIILGMLYHGKVFFEWITRKKQLPVHFLLAVWFAAAFAVGCSVDSAKYYKVNFIHIPIILYGGIGVICLCKMVKKIKLLPVVIAAVYLFSFGYFVYLHVSFEVNYDYYGNPALSHMHWYQYEEALDRAKELTEGPIAIIGVNYANVMLYEQISPWDYMEQVVYSEGEDMEFKSVESIGRYFFNLSPEEEVQNGTVFVYHNAMAGTFRELGYETERVTGCYGVAH